MKNSLTKLLLAFILSLSVKFLTCAQITTTISAGTGFTDVTLVQCSLPSLAYLQTSNYNIYPRIESTSWTMSGSPINYRTLLNFDLSSIPAGSIIQSATLSFYSDPNITSGIGSNQSLSGSNSCVLQKVTAAWSPTSVTWNTQPATTTTNRVWIPPSVSSTENISVDITSMLQDMVSNPASNFGMMLMLENEINYRSRNYASTDHSNTAIRPKLVITYVLPSDPLQSKLDSVFGGLNQAYINTGILTDYGLDLIDHTLFDGTIKAENQMSMESWRVLYGSLLSSVINPSSNMVHLSTINQQIDNNWATYNLNNPTVDIPTLFIGYQSLRSDAVSQNLISVNNERLADVAGRTQSPYTTGFAFAAAPTTESDKDGNVNFIFRSSLFINSSSKTFSSFAVDFGDGAGYQPILPDVVKNIIYSTAGVKTLQFKIQFSDGSIYYSHSKFNILQVLPGTSSSRLASDPNINSFIFPRSKDGTCPENFPNPGGGYAATVTVRYSTAFSRPAMNCNPQLVKPFIVVEGYDPSKFSAFKLSNWSYEDFANQPRNGDNGNINNLLPSNITFKQALNDAGYDIIFIDLVNNTEDIINNALLVENVIQWVNAHKIVNPNTGLREKTVLLGQSMGGLITRYAVCDMEKKWAANPTSNPSHEIRLLVTQDSPHRGANVPLGLQALVNDLAPYRLTKLGLASYGIIGGIIGSRLQVRDIVPSLDQVYKLLNNEASSGQMLIAQDNKVNTFLDGTYRNMITFSVGYTPSFDMQALSNGSECGVGQVLQPGGEIFYADANLYVNRLFFFFATDVLSGLASTAPGLGVITKGVLDALVPFTGKNWHAKYVVNATSVSGGNQVFSGNLSVTKKIWFIKLFTINLFNKSRNSPSGTLPFDSSPGGYYNLQSYQASIPNNPNINAYPIIQANLEVRLASAFCFIPTPSALDIASPITNTSLSSTYVNKIESTFQSRFSNFITQEKSTDTGIRMDLGNYNNSGHIHFTSKNANWLLNEMENKPQAINCSSNCNPLAGLSISGPLSICTNGQYTVPNLPADASVIWSASGSLSPTSGTGNSFSVSAVSGSNGSATITATITNACGSQAVPINVGVTASLPAPSFTYMSIQPVGANNCISLGTLCRFTADIIPNVSQDGGYDWIIPSGWGYSTGQGTRMLDLYAPSSGSFTPVVQVRVHNSCATSAYTGRQINLCGSSPMKLSYSVYPNPTQNEFKVEKAAVTGNEPITNTTQINEASLSNINTENFEIHLYSTFGKEVRSGKSREGKIDINTTGLENGIYSLKVYKNGYLLETQQVVIVH